jgi:hypothetical protein
MAQTAMLSIVEAPPVPGLVVRYFCGSGRGCVVERGEEREVYLGGVLLGSWREGETAARNVLLVTLTTDPRIRVGKVAAAFGLSEERARQIRRQHEQHGPSAIVRESKGGVPRKRTPELEAELEQLFEQGFTIQEATRRMRGSVSQTLVGRVHRDYVLRGAKHQNGQEEGAALGPVDASVANLLVGANDVTDELSDAAPVEAAPAQLTASGSSAAFAPEAPEGDAAFPNAARSEEPPQRATSPAPTNADQPAQAQDATTGGSSAAELSTVEPTTPRVPQECSLEAAVHRGGAQVQHLGSWIMLAVLNDWGVYRLLENLRHDLSAQGRRISTVALRVVIDAVVIALCAGQQCVEGVRRIATPSAGTLLRFRHGITPTWARQVLGRFAEKRGQLFHLAAAKLLLTQAAATREVPERAVFYVDNHLRPYTGQQTLRKGWRMQAKRSQPGSSDYYVHDEDGRPVLRFECPEHTSMTKVLTPIGRALRDLIGKDGTRVVLVFDRAGAYPTQMAELRNGGFEFVTYERAPYQQLPSASFEHEFEFDGERIAYVEARDKNLRGGRGRVRRICARMTDEHQVNVIAISKDQPEEVLSLLFRRWARQENQFKHGVERWGINQLDGRGVEPYPPGTVIPNPARRRLDRAIAISRDAEAKLLRELSRLETDDAKRERLEAEVVRQRELQEQLLAQRPVTPRRAALEDTDLADKLVHHQPNYKLMLDMLRILLANAESELATRLGPHLVRPAEAKKTLANLLVAPGTVRLARRRVTITLQPAGTPRELDAFEHLARHLNELPLSLPGDPTQRRLHVRIQQHAGTAF